jgi:hypothetical protein
MMGEQRTMLRGKFVFARVCFELRELQFLCSRSGALRLDRVQEQERWYRQLK